MGCVSLRKKKKKKKEKRLWERIHEADFGSVLKWKICTDRRNSLSTGMTKNSNERHDTSVNPTCL